MEHQIRKTALADLHEAAGGRMVDFAGWWMPVWFEGIAAEHKRVRTQVGLFDVSHMGQIQFTGNGAVDLVDYLVTNNVKALPPGHALYTPMCHPSGGIVDDLIVYKRSDQDLLLCVNASTTEKDFQHMQKFAREGVTMVNLSDQYSQIAVQGPRAYDVLARIWPEVAATLKPFDFQEFTFEGETVLVAGTGYTGERGYELYVPWSSGPRYWQLFLETGKDLGAAPIGLGARDTLRLEAKFCLYGNDINDDTNPLEAGLKWTVDFSNDFVGRDKLMEAEAKGLDRKLVGFKMLDRGIPRQHYPILVDGQTVGEVTSGTTSPTLGENIGLGYVASQYSKRGTEFEIGIRSRGVRAAVVKTPFYKTQS